MDQDELIAKLLTARGLTTPDKQQEFFSPPHPLDIPLELSGLNKQQVIQAVQLIKQHLSADHLVAVYGDYDVDGLTAAAMLWETLYRTSSKVFPFIPHRREDGYGLSVSGIDQCLSAGAKLIIAVDNGIVAHSEAAYCRDHDCDLIIIDHHEPASTPPPATVILHSTYTCAAGLVWFFIREFGHPQPQLLLSLACLGVICDIVPLLGLNRSLAKYGLQELNATTRPGFLALFEEAHLIPGSIDAYHVGFIIGPRLNAMGRLEHALDSLRLLCTTDISRATQLALLLGATNRTRQQLTEDSVRHALAQINSRYGENLPKILLVSDPSYDQGIIGLIAAKITEKYSRPSIAISIGDTYSKASARSVPGFHITEHLRLSADLLTGVGGHAMAAGFTVQNSHLEALSHQVITHAQSLLPEELLIPRSRVDALLPFGLISPQLVSRLDQFAPFGLGNPKPVFFTPRIEIREPKTIGATAQHLKFYAGNFEAVYFNYFSAFPGKIPPPISGIIYSLDNHTYQGQTRLQLIVRQFTDHEPLTP